MDFRRRKVKMAPGRGQVGSIAVRAQAADCRPCSGVWPEEPRNRCLLIVWYCAPCNETLFVTNFCTRGVLSRFALSPEGARGERADCHPPLHWYFRLRETQNIYCTGILFSYKLSGQQSISQLRNFLYAGRASNGRASKRRFSPFVKIKNN